MLKIHIELDKQRGLSINGYLSPAVLQGLITVLLGLVSLPWLTHLAQALGLI